MSANIVCWMHAKYMYTIYATRNKVYGKVIFLWCIVFPLKSINYKLFFPYWWLQCLASFSPAYLTVGLISLVNKIFCFKWTLNYMHVGVYLVYFLRYKVFTILLFQESQYKKGGHSLCLRNKRVANEFRKLFSNDIP